MQIIMMMGS